MPAVEYQYGFSEAHREAMYDLAARQQKARKMLAVLDDYYGGQLAGLSLLDLGCSTGIIASVLGTRFGWVYGVDIDEPAVKNAQSQYASEKLQFSVCDALHLPARDDSFDVAVCAHVYEHVPDARRLMAEIRRVLKPGGVCYFAAPNRLKFIEGHHGLPLLSWLPKRLGHLYLRLAGKGRFYYETHLTYWGLRRLVRDFEVIDYTLKVIADPGRYAADEMLAAGSLKQRLALLVTRLAYWLVPTYLWLLRKRSDT